MVDGGDQADEVVVVRPDDADRDEADRVAEVARPQRAKRGDQALRVGQDLGRRDPDLEDEQGDRDREDAVAECLESLRAAAALCVG